MNLQFVKLAKNHLKKVMKWRNSTHIKSHMYSEPKITYSSQLLWFSKINNDQQQKYWIIREDNVDVGLVCLTDINHIHKRCSWAYYLGEESSWGKGIGKQVELNILNYVFSYLKLNKLCCEVLSSNQKVVDIHIKYGSSIEGKLRDHIFKKKLFHDVIIMGITKSDWEKIKNNFEISKAQIEE